MLICLTALYYVVSFSIKIELDICVHILPNWGVWVENAYADGCRQIIEYFMKLCLLFRAVICSCFSLFFVCTAQLCLPNTFRPVAKTVWAAAQRLSEGVSGVFKCIHGCTRACWLLLVFFLYILGGQVRREGWAALLCTICQIWACLPMC